MNQLIRCGVVTMCAVSSVAYAAALSDADLQPAAIRTAVAAKPAAERAAYAKEILTAIITKPGEDADKIQAITRAARALITGSAKGGAIAVIAQVYDSVPVNLLTGVSDLLQPGFSQTTNKMSDEQYDAFCATVVQQGAAFIEQSGTDAPTVRMSLLAAVFVKGSTDADRTREKMLAVLPTSAVTAAAVYVKAAEANDTETLAAAAGVDAVEAAPADPDTVVVKETATETTDTAAETTDTVAEATETETPATDTSADTTATEPTEDQPKVVTVPLLARMSNDILGQSMDTLLAVQFDWETADDTLSNPPLGTLVGTDVTVIPGDAESTGVDTGVVEDVTDPSPLYPNQR